MQPESGGQGPWPGMGLERDRDSALTRHPARRREELLAHGATVVVLSLGMNRRLQVDPRTLDYPARRSVTAHTAQTREAVRIYNKLAQGSPVAGLFHSTC